MGKKIKHQKIVYPEGTELISKKYGIVTLVRRSSLKKGKKIFVRYYGTSYWYLADSFEILKR